jgi:hypothetical protein
MMPHSSLSAITTSDDEHPPFVLYDPAARADEQRSNPLASYQVQQILVSTILFSHVTHAALSQTARPLHCPHNLLLMCIRLVYKPSMHVPKALQPDTQCTSHLQRRVVH